MHLIQPLLDLLFPQRESARIVDTLSPLYLCGHRRTGTIVASGVQFLLSYKSEKVRACITEAKFHANPKATKLLASLLETYPFPDTCKVVPVPLSKQRRKTRGYNQVEEVLRAANIQYSPLLERVRDTLPQTRLSDAQRMENVFGAFRCITTLSPIPIYVLIDDVSTTGSTLLQAKIALEQAGATKIQLISLAH